MAGQAIDQVDPLVSPGGDRHGAAGGRPQVAHRQELVAEACWAAGIPHDVLQFVRTPTECQACHLNDYLGASNPNHIAAGFPTGCDACHASGIWQQARFDHDSIFFPIYSGEHRNRWSGCSTCSAR